MPTHEFKESISRPRSVDSKSFRMRPPTPGEGSSSNLLIMQRNTGTTMIVDRADIPEFIADLQEAYNLKHYEL